MIFDTHCHLYDDAFKDDLKQVINNSLNNNVKLFMVPSDAPSRKPAVHGPRPQQTSSCRPATR